MSNAFTAPVLGERKFMGRIVRTTTTIQDVARRAGVAASTVSYVLNNGPKTIGEETAARVRAAALELGYSSNRLARGLVTGKAWAIGVLVYVLEANWAAQQLAGVEEVAQEAGYKVVVASHRQDPALAIQLLSDMAAWRLDGILSLSATLNDHPAVQRHLTEQILPCVFSYHEPPHGTRIDGVSVDQVQGGRLATEHLLAQGRRRIAFLGGPGDHIGVIGRLAGYRAAMQAAGQTPNERHVRCADGFYVPDGLPIAHDWFDPAHGPVPDAVCGKRQSGRRRASGVPTARPVGAGRCGRDRLRRYRQRHDRPSLSSVAMPLIEVGRQSMRRLLARLENPADWQPETIRLPCALRLRASSLPGQ